MRLPLWSIAMVSCLTGCGGSPPSDGVEPLAYVASFDLLNGPFESTAPVSLSDDGTLVTWWWNTPNSYNPVPSEFGATSWDLVSGELLGGAPGGPLVGAIYGPPVTTAITDDGWIAYAADRKLCLLQPSAHPWWCVPIGSTPSTGVALGRDGTIFVGDAGSVFYAFTGNGDPLWATALPGAGYGHPLIDRDDTIWFATKHVDGTWSLVSLVDGAVDVDVPIGTPVASLALDEDDHVLVSEFTGTGDIAAAPPEAFTLSAYESDGTLAWSVVTDGAAASPIVGPDGTIYASINAGEVGHLDALRPSDGHVRWRTDLPETLWPPTLLDNGQVVAGCGLDLCGYDASSGHEDFRYLTFGSVVGSPLARDGIIVASTAGGTTSWDAGAHVSTESRGWARLGADDRLTGRAR